MRFNIDEHQWYRCPQCQKVFNKELMYEVFEKRTRAQEKALEKFAEGEARENARKLLWDPPTCPDCSAARVKRVLQLGDNTRRKLQRKAMWMEIVEWVKARIPLLT